MAFNVSAPISICRKGVLHMLKLISNSNQTSRDIELARRIYRGDHNSISYFIRHYTEGMRCTAQRITQNEADTDDCVQIALINALDHIKQFNGTSSLETWLKRIVTNTALMQLRSQSRRKEEPLDLCIQNHRNNNNQVLTTQICRGPKRVDDIVFQKESRLAIFNALRRLPRPYRATFFARDIVGFNTQETASLLEITPELVRTRLRRARVSLRPYLAAYCNAEAA